MTLIKAMHSNLNDEKNIACGMLIFHRGEKIKIFTFNLYISPLKTLVNGPAPQLNDEDVQDILDEAITVFRPNLLFKNYDINGPGDIFLIYTMIFITHCIRTIENENSQEKAKQKLMEIVKEPIPNPSDNGYFMKGILKEPKTGQELELYKSYLRQAKEELVNRLLNKLYFNGQKGIDFKFWVGLSKKNFMGLKYKKF